MAIDQAEKKGHRKKKRFLFIYAYIVAILLILSTVATYAWFSLSVNPRVSNLSFYINSFQGMEISLTPDGEYSQQITYDDLFSAQYELRPATYSQKENRFYGLDYYFDGKIRDKWVPLNEQIHANSTAEDNYYCVGTFYARTGADTDVSLAPAVTVNDDASALSGTYLMGKPEWNAERVIHENKGIGAENAIRIAINIVRLDAEFNPTGEEDFFIYEPNANTHNSIPSGYVQTPSIDGTDSLIDQEKIITQSVSRWGDVTPVQHDVLRYHAGTFDGSAKLFSMKADEVVQIRIFIWLEGQDIDCTDAISNAAVIANLQFDAQTSGGSGVVPIPPKNPDNPDNNDEN